MSTAVAAPSPAAILPLSVNHTSPRHFTSSAAPASRSPSNVEHSARRGRTESSPAPTDRPHLVDQSSSASKPSPNSCVVHGHLRLRAPVTDEFPSDRFRIAQPPSIKVKREPGSPSLSSARPRPKRLDLSSSNTALRGPQTARPAPLTSRDSAGLVAMQDVGLACLSPGFQTNDPSMREQLQRSLDVRDQQRLIIEARQKGTKPGSSRDPDAPRTQDTTLFGVQTKTPMTARRKGPPPGLSIHAPSAAHFANDRVIQSAPMHQTFTGLRPGEHPMSRHVQHGPSGLSQTSHIHHVPATQTNNRLPPLADVFAQDNLDAARGHSTRSPNHSHAPPPVPSPGFPPAPHAQAPGSARAREFRSADEAMQSMSGGRDDLMPKVVHYGGVQPPTPPSPSALHRPYHHQPPQPTAPAPPLSLHHRPEPELARNDNAYHLTPAAGRRRTREEYERDNGSPPTTFQRAETKRATLHAGRPDDPPAHPSESEWLARMSTIEKKEEFLRLCERAWELFHS